MSKISIDHDRIDIDGTGIEIDQSGQKQLYDSGLKYDSGLYYDRWGVNPKQGERVNISK